MKNIVMLVLTEEQARRLANGLGDLRVVNLNTEPKLVHRFYQALSKRHDKRLADEGVTVDADPDDVVQLDLRSVLPND